MEAEEPAVNASERPSAPTGSFITAVRDVIRRFSLEGGGASVGERFKHVIR